MTFSTVKHLQNRTGKYGTGRNDYLQQLVTEFTDTADQSTSRVTNYCIVFNMLTR